MEENILSALLATKNSDSCLASVIFQNKLTNKVSFYNGVTHQFEFITEIIFNHLLENKKIKLERCICQGDNRYIAM